MGRHPNTLVQTALTRFSWAVLPALLAACTYQRTYIVPVEPSTYSPPAIDGKASVKLLVKLSLKQSHGYVSSTGGDLISASQLVTAVESNFKACLEAAGAVVVPADMPDSSVSAMVAVNILRIRLSDAEKEVQSSVFLTVGGKALYSKSITGRGQSVREAIAQIVRSTACREEFLRLLKDG